MADLVSESVDTDIVDGFIRARVFQTWKVEGITTTAFDMLSLVDSDPDVPDYGESTVWNGQTLYCIRKATRRFDDGPGRTTGLVDVVYSNDGNEYMKDEMGEPVFDNLEDVAPYLQVQYSEEWERVSRGVFVRVENESGATVTPPPTLTTFGTNRMPILNSAGLPHESAKRLRHFRQLIYWTWHATWDDTWDAYVDSLNEDAFTITQTDQMGIRLQFSLAARECRLAEIIKEDHWKGDRLWFRRGLVLQRDVNGWEYRHPDEGFAKAIFVGQTNPETGQAYTNQELAGYGVGPLAPINRVLTHEVFKDKNDVPLTQPVRLNGYGNKSTDQRPGVAPYFDHNYFVVYKVETETDYPTVLGIS